MSAPTVGSLFTGIGGIDLGLERAGFVIRWQCESDPYARGVLARHWPDVPCHPDAWRLSDDVGAIDVLAGGYPCQPFSYAGARTGEDDPRNLWPAYLRAIRLLRPGHAVLENVPGHLSLGFGRVLADLAGIGYDVEWACVPAAAVGAPHLRWRLFAIAHANGHGQPECAVDALSRPGLMVPDTGSQAGRRVGDGRREQLTPCSEGAGYVADPGGEGWQRTGRGHRDVQPRQRPGRPTGGGWWESEPDVGRVAHGVPDRVDRLRCLGNAVVPQVAELVGRRLMAHLVSGMGSGMRTPRGGATESPPAPNVGNGTNGEGNPGPMHGTDERGHV